ncbi:MAG: hypothetical protein IKV78_02585 [Methanocorpusculum sp.]|nr:hypothetical protein [Methanocorpusculum sp.]
MGSFLYDVKAIVDKASFAEGIRELQKLEQTSKKLITGIAGVAASVISSATIAGEVATQELKVAKAIGTSTEALSSWKIAANVAGASASGLIGQLSALESKMQHLKTGVVDTSLAKNLGMLGVGYGDFAEMDTEDRMRTVFHQADQMEDQKLAATLVGDILGQAGQDYYLSLQMSGKSIEQQLAEAKQLNFVSEQNRKEAALFTSEIRAVKEAGKSITMLFGTEIASALTPTVRTIKNYLITNRDAIRKGIAGFAQQTATVFNMIAGIIGKVAPIVTGLIDKFGGLDKIIIKVGIGFASMKLMQVAGGIKAIVSGINLLKAGLGGLAMGGLFLIFEDIINHFMGGNSFIFDRLLPKIKELKEEFNIHIDTQTFKDLAEALKKARDNTEGLRKALGLIGEVAIVQTLDLITDAINGVAAAVLWAMQLFNAFSEGGFSGGMEFIKQSIKDAGDETKDHPFQEHAKNALNITSFLTNPKGHALSLGMAATATLMGKKKADDSADDAIISPSGKITKLSPDDWVFAMKDISDLAAGFMPAGVSNTNNMNAPANYVINQSFSIGSGVRASEVKAQAYKGTAEALQNNLSNASRIMQLMPGTR